MYIVKFHITGMSYPCEHRFKSLASAKWFANKCLSIAEDNDRLCSVDIIKNGKPIVWNKKPKQD